MPDKDWLGLGVGVTVLDDTVDAAVVAKAYYLLNPKEYIIIIMIMIMIIRILPLIRKIFLNIFSGF